MFSLILLMMTSLYITIYMQSFETYIKTLDNYRVIERQEIEQRMTEEAPNEINDDVEEQRRQAP